MTYSLGAFALACLSAPFLPGFINRIKARLAGRKGSPLLQGYYDFAKLLHKGMVYSTATSSVFSSAPIICLASSLSALLFIPWGPIPALISFQGDFLVFGLLLAAGRFAMISAALDTASSFEGMGASREGLIGILAEPGLMLSLGVLAMLTGSLSLSGMAAELSYEFFSTHGHLLLLIGAALFVLLLAENSRMPVDDPTTHLELTMIHEVLILDHSGKDLAILHAASWLKLWIFSALVALPLTPKGFGLGADALFFAGIMLAVVALVGLIESSLARLRLARIPQFAVSGIALAVLALIMTWR